MMHAQKGFSIVELMIALALGSLITLAAVQLFSTNQRTFQLQQGLTDVQEQGRFALDYISRDLRTMGLRDPDVASADPGLLLADSTVNGVVVPASQDGGGVGAGNDRLTFSFHARAGDTDCEGDIAGAAALVANTYWVAGPNQDQLFCAGSVDPLTAGLVLVEGVDSFQVQLGVDTTVDGVPAAGHYRRINEVVATDQIVSVRIGLLVRATQGNLPTSLAPPQDLLVLDRVLTAGDPPLEDVTVRRLFTSTVRARNYVWENI
ncbi:MAG: PilW family protein [Alcanivoracaceae bacterium]|nr:PilW family protein [Alcanivoracaceae bacterium]